MTDLTFFSSELWKRRKRRRLKVLGEITAKPYRSPDSRQGDPCREPRASETRMQEGVRFPGHSTACWSPCFRACDEVWHEQEAEMQKDWGPTAPSRSHPRAGLLPGCTQSEKRPQKPAHWAEL